MKMGIFDITINQMIFIHDEMLNKLMYDHSMFAC